MQIELYKKEDLEDVVSLYKDCLERINSQDYTEEEIKALESSTENESHWQFFLEKDHTLIAKEDDEIIGFANVGQTGFVDLICVEKEYLRQGIATELLSRLEEYAKEEGNNVVNTYSFITSKPFFESQGYDVISEQLQHYKGVAVMKYLMEKKL